MLAEIKSRLQQLASPERAKVSQRFFKTGPGEYGEGDRFLGNTVPDLRKLAKEFSEISQIVVLELLHSPIHEERVLALLILNLKFQQGNEKERTNIHLLYLRNHKWINNWDLVDCSAPILIGQYLLHKDTSRLNQLASSKNLWERRTAMVATLSFIRNNKPDVAVRIAALLLNDPEDLIHKASGWMLREIGKKFPGVLESFLRENAAVMPRTMLRYAIEKFPEAKRKEYLAARSTTGRATNRT